MNLLTIDLFTDSDAILKILSIDISAKVKVNSDSSYKTVQEFKFSQGVSYSQPDLQAF